MAKILMIVAIVIAVFLANMSYVEGHPQPISFKRTTACESDQDCTTEGEKCCFRVLYGLQCQNPKDVFYCTSPKLTNIGKNLIGKVADQITG